MTLTDDEVRAIDEAARVAMREADSGDVTVLMVSAEGSWCIERHNRMGARTFNVAGNMKVETPGEALRRLVGR